MGIIAADAFTPPERACEHMARHSVREFQGQEILRSKNSGRPWGKCNLCNFFLNMA